MAFWEQRTFWRGGAEESADGNPRKFGKSATFTKTLELVRAPRTKSTDKARSRLACGKGRRELQHRALRQAGPLGWVAMAADGTTGNHEKIRRCTGLKEARLA